MIAVRIFEQGGYGIVEGVSVLTSSSAWVYGSFLILLFIKKRFIRWVALVKGMALSWVCVQARRYAKERNGNC